MGRPGGSARPRAAPLLRACCSAALLLLAACQYNYNYDPCNTYGLQQPAVKHSGGLPIGLAFWINGKVTDWDNTVSYINKSTGLNTTRSYQLHPCADKKKLAAITTTSGVFYNGKVAGALGNGTGGVPIQPLASALWTAVYRPTTDVLSSFVLQDELLAAYVAHHANDTRCSGDGVSATTDQAFFQDYYLVHGIAPSPPPPAYGTYAFACVVNFGTQVTPWVYAPDGNLYRNAAASLPPGVAQSMQSSVSVNVTACSDVVTTSRLLNESLSACTGTVVQSLATGNLTCVAGCPGAVYPSNSTVSGYACNGSLAATDSLPSTAGGPGYAVLAFGYPPFNCTPGSAAPACLLATPSATAAAGGSPAAAACRAVCATSPAGPFANASLCAAACGGAAFNSAANVSVCPAVCDPAGAFAGTAVCAANGTAALARSFWYNGSACSNSSAVIAAGNTDSTAVAGEASTTLACPAGAASWAPSAAASLTYGAGTGSNCTSACGDSGGAGPAANATNCTLACGSSLGGYSSPLFFEPFSRGGACFGPANASASFVLVTTGATSNCTLTLLNGTNVTLGNVTSCAQATPRCPNGEVPANTAANFVSVVAYGPTVRSTARYVRSNVSSLTGAVGILTNLVLIATYSSGLLASLDWQDLGCGECAGQGSAQCMYVGSDVGGNARHGCAQQAAACYGYNATTAVPTDHGVNVTVTAGENPCAAGCAQSLFVGASGADAHGLPLTTGGQLSILTRYSVTSFASAVSSLAKSYYGTAVSTTTANAPGINGGNTVAGRRRLFAAPFEGAGGWAQWLWGRR